MHSSISQAGDKQVWDAFIAHAPDRPFLQSWTMGDVYRDIGQEPIRLQVMQDGTLSGICMGIVISARRGKHIAIPYGPLATDATTAAKLASAMATEAVTRGCSFVRMSPFVPITATQPLQDALRAENQSPLLSPLHLLAEHIWRLPLQNVTEETLLLSMRKTTRNLIRRAEKDGVTVRASTDPLKDIEIFIRLHDETRKRHGFTPYTNAFFRSQVQHFAERGECTLYLAEYQHNVIASSIHMHAFGETSYHHGASDSAQNKIPASYLLQWTAIKDALRRGDHIYSFWGIAPMARSDDGSLMIAEKTHPFAGVTLFKTGFGGELLDLTPCIDLPLLRSYWLTRGFEIVRKWRRGF